MTRQPATREKVGGSSGRGSIGRRTAAHNTGRAAGGRTVAARPLREDRSTFRIPIAVKYAVITGVLLVLFMIILGKSLLGISLETADREINDKGIKAALIFSTGTEPFWLKEPVTEEERTFQQTSQEKLEQELKAFIEGDGAEGVLEVLVLDKSGDQFIASAKGGEKVQLRDERELPLEAAAKAGVVVRMGNYQSGSRVMRARSYQRAIFSKGETAGHVRIFLSAEAIQGMQESLSQEVTLYVVVSMLVGIVIVVLVGSLLTRPIRTLKKDMQVVAGGDLTHQSTIRTGDEIDQLAAAFNRMTANLHLAQEQEASRKALERELSIATTIQTALLPDRIPSVPGYEIFPYYASAKEVGGDYYDFLPVGPERYLVVVADVSGKGIPGSLVMTMTRSLMRMAARHASDPAEILQRVNASLSKDMTRGMFVTLILADFDVGRGVVKIARAGHNPAYLYRAAQQDLVAILPDGIALGMDAGEMFDKVLKVQEVPFEPGDFIALYTDGIVEAMDPDDNEYTSERFAAVLKALHEQSARKIVESVVADVEKHARGAEPSDDITLLVLKRDG